MHIIIIEHIIIHTPTHRTICTTRRDQMARLPLPRCWPVEHNYIKSKWRDIWIRDVFWSQHLGCWGQNTSRIQHKEVLTPSKLRLLFPRACSLRMRCGCLPSHATSSWSSPASMERPVSFVYASLRGDGFRHTTLYVVGCNRIKLLAQ